MFVVVVFLLFPDVSRWPFFLSAFPDIWHGLFGVYLHIIRNFWAFFLKMVNVAGVGFVLLIFIFHFSNHGFCNFIWYCRQSFSESLLSMPESSFQCYCTLVYQKLVVVIIKILRCPLIVTSNGVLSYPS